MVSLQFDESALVEAPKGKSSLKFEDEKQQARFELGVSMMVYKWDALDVAVDNQWGGVDSAAKRDWITGVICDNFKTEKLIDVAYVEDILLYAMVDEFDTTVEDDSALPIAAGIVELYKKCEAMDFSDVETLYLAFQEKQKNKDSHAGHRHVQVVEDPLNPDGSSSEEEEDDEEDIEDGDVDMEVDEEARPEPVVDEDGFEMVQKKGRRRH